MAIPSLSIAALCLLLPTTSLGQQQQQQHQGQHQRQRQRQKNPHHSTCTGFVTTIGRNNESILLNSIHNNGRRPTVGVTVGYPPASPGSVFVDDDDDGRYYRNNHNMFRNSIGRRRSNPSILQSSFQQYEYDNDHYYYQSSTTKRSPTTTAAVVSSTRKSSLITRITRQQKAIMLKILSKMNQYIRSTLLALSTCALVFFSFPTSNSWAAAASSSSSSNTPPSYYLQNNPKHNPQPVKKQTIVSITQNSHSTTTNNNSDSDYKILKKPSTTTNPLEKQRAVKRISTFVLGATIAASSFRASLRKTKRRVRTATPFGRIRNASSLGNGVSIIRVCMALRLEERGDGDDENENSEKNGIGRKDDYGGNGGVGGGNGGDGVVVDGSLFKRLQLEEKELNGKTEMLTPNQVDGSFASKIKQKAMGEYLSNVASTFLQYRDTMQYGSIDSIRVPFVEEATKALQRASNEERRLFERARKKRQYHPQSTTMEQSQQSTTAKSYYVLATILLAIKGDHTTVPLPFGIIRRRDMVRALGRIVTDATVDDCLVGAELLMIPNQVSAANIGGYGGLAEGDMLDSFPELVPLT